MLLAYLLPVSLLAALLALSLWAAPNNVGPKIDREPIWKQMIWLGGFISMVGLVFAVLRLLER